VTDGLRSRGGPLRVAILAGGLGTRLSEETAFRPKPMIDIGGWPVLWHIIKGYEAHGFDRFVVALGYKGEVVKSFFLNYQALSADLTISMGDASVRQHREKSENWTVDLVDTGIQTNTGGRVLRLRNWLPDEDFCLTYGDGLSDVDPRAVIETHRRNGCVATVTAVRPPARFGGLDLDGERVSWFREKPAEGEGWINGGFMVVNRRIFDHIPSEDCNFETEVLGPLAEAGELAAHRHEGFWQCMDTLRDVRHLQRLWDSGSPPWKTWS
jgi:glucose-1-phosphate cytidylyltransferase